MKYFVHESGKIFICLTFLFLATPANAGEIAKIRTCTHEEAFAAEDAVDYIKTWKGLNAMFLKYGHCDDGAIGEGFTEATTKLLSARWDKLSELLVLISANNPFRQFVIRHVNASADENNLRKILENAEKRSPKNCGSFCADIRKAASEALLEIANESL